jgi:hypothetical protein
MKTRNFGDSGESGKPACVPASKIKFFTQPSFMLGPYNFGSDENEKLWRVWREEACALRA